MNENTVSLIGSHNTKNGAGADWPARVVFLNGGYGMGEEHKDTMMIFRKAGVPERPPDLYTHPEAKTLEFARYYYSDPNNVVQEPFKPTWDGLPPGYIKTFTNEACGTDRHEMETYIAYERNMCELAYADGHILGIGKFASGTPRWDSGLWQELYAPWLVEAWNKYQAIYVRHIYGYPNSDLNDPGDLVDENGNLNTNIPTSAQRIVDELDYLKALGWGGGVAFTETGLQGGYGVTDWNRFYFQITKFEQVLRPYADHVIGFCWWECGKTEDWDADYTEYLKQMTPYMIENALPKWEPPEPTEPTPEDKPKHVSFKIAQEHTRDEWAELAGIAYDDYKRSMTAAHTAAINEVQSGNSESYAYIVDPSLPSQVATIAEFEKLGLTWKPLLFRDSQSPDVILPIPHMTQRDNIYTNDCGPAATAMVISGMTTHTPTVDELSEIMQGDDPNTYTSFDDIDRALNLYDMDGTRQRPFMPDEIETTIRDGEPVIALVWYQALPVQYSSFNGSHFIVIYGTKGEKLLYHDPLMPQGQGDILEISRATLTDAMAQVIGTPGNLPYQGMVCSVKDDAPPVDPPPAGNKIDLLPYIKGDGRLYEVRNSSGGQERFQTQSKSDGEFWQTKNSLAEQLFGYGDLIYRGWDTSPGNGRYYVQQQSGANQAQWLPRMMAVNEVFTTSLRVQFYDWNCQPSAENSGNVTDTRRFVAHHPVWTSPYGITLNDVVQLEWVNGGESYWYARDFGLVGWGRTHDDPNTPASSAISEIHAPGQRPDNVVDLPGCIA